jgi:hypothetical protein
MNVTSERLGQSARNNARRSSSARKVKIDLIVASGFEGVTTEDPFFAPLQIRLWVAFRLFLWWQMRLKFV